jgi:hypothetical protein
LSRIRAADLNRFTIDRLMMIVNRLCSRVEVAVKFKKASPARIRILPFGDPARLSAVQTHVVFCNTAAGDRSAQVGCYYSGPENKFWPMLETTGLTPKRLAPKDGPRLHRYGIGFIDLVKHHFGNDYTLQPDMVDFADFERGRSAPMRALRGLQWQDSAGCLFQARQDKSCDLWFAGTDHWIDVAGCSALDLRPGRVLLG